MTNTPENRHALETIEERISLILTAEEYAAEYSK